MGGFSAWHWIIVALVILVLFGRGKISETMGDFGRGIKSFKKGLGEEETPQQQTPPPPTPQIAPPPSEQPAPSADTTATTTDSSSNSN